MIPGPQIPILFKSIDRLVLLVLIVHLFPFWFVELQSRLEMVAGPCVQIFLLLVTGSEGIDVKVEWPSLGRLIGNILTISLSSESVFLSPDWNIIAKASPNFQVPTITCKIQDRRTSNEKKKEKIRQHQDSRGPEDTSFRG